MKYKLINILILILVFSFANCKKETSNTGNPQMEMKEDKLNFQNRLYVTASSLKIRTEPNLKANSLGTLSKGDSIRVLEEGGEEVSVEDKTAKWGKVTIGESTGWIYLGFISNEPPNLLSEKEIENITRNYERDYDICNKEEERLREQHKNDPSYQSCTICGCGSATSESVNNDRGCTQKKLDEVIELAKRKGETSLSYDLFKEYGDMYCESAFRNTGSQCVTTKINFMKLNKELEEAKKN